MAGGKEKIFRFKQFAMSNHLSAMKVGTDGVLLGAWTTVDGARRVLDIGTGTGLIALMIAQRNAGATVVGIDIDEPSAREASLNFASSPWTHRMRAIYGDILAMDFTSWPRFDLIVSNPPYFDVGPEAPVASRSRARHDSALSLASLFAVASRLLSDGGRLSIIIPADRQHDAEAAAAGCGLRPVRTAICDGGGSKRHVQRYLGEFVAATSALQPLPPESLTIRNADGTLTPAFAALTQDFYL